MPSGVGNGTIFLRGNSANEAAWNLTRGTNQNLTLARFSPAGSLDAVFGTFSQGNILWGVTTNITTQTGSTAPALDINNQGSGNLITGRNWNNINFTVDQWGNVNTTGQYQINGVPIGGLSWGATITGGSGADTIDGGGGADTLSGGAGDDTIAYYGTETSIDGGTGSYTLVLAASSTVTAVNFAVPAGSDQTTGDTVTITNFENLNASAMTTALTVTGSSGANAITTGSAASARVPS